MAALDFLAFSCVWRRCDIPCDRLTFPRANLSAAGWWSRGRTKKKRHQEGELDQAHKFDLCGLPLPSRWFSSGLAFPSLLYTFFQSKDHGGDVIVLRDPKGRVRHHPRLCPPADGVLLNVFACVLFSLLSRICDLLACPLRRQFSLGRGVKHPLKKPYSKEQ